jgi:tetratricopeptide (TPR) repeat protein
VSGDGKKAGNGSPGKAESAATLNARGMDLTAAERYPEAIAAFDRALELEPGNPGLLFNRGEAYRRAGSSIEAKTDIEAALAIEGESADLLLALGLIAYEADDFEEAAARYERALALKTDFPEAWNDLGVVEFRREDYERARAAFEKAVGLDPAYVDAWLNLADAYDELGMARERREAMARIRELGGRAEKEE